MDSPVAATDTRALIEEKVRTDRLHLLFRQSLLAVYGSFVAACMLAWLYWDKGNQQHIVMWLSLLGAATTMRLCVFRAYYRSPLQQQVPQRWERVYWITLLIAAGIWGGGALVVMPKGDPLAQAIALFFTIGMSGSAVSTYSAYRSMTLASIVLVLLPTTCWMLYQGGATEVVMAITTLIFAASVVRATRELSEALERAFRLTHEMELAHAILSQTAQTDDLTGLKNRRAFFEGARQQFSYSKRNRGQLCALVIDIDHFKQINDSRGHSAGDEVLRHVGALLATAFREADVCGRLGGEEFAVLLADTAAGAALTIAETLRQAIATMALPLNDASSLQITASIGVAIASADDTLNSLLQRADQAMYRAKALGRNCVVSA